MPSLPSELFFHICSFLSSTSDLAVLARVSPQWCAVAQRVLYQHLNVSHAPGPLTTLAANSRLAILVRSFSVSVADKRLYDLLARALASMTHLTELDLFVDSDQSTILRNSTSYPLLHRFATSLPWSDHLEHFLHNSPTITQLYLDSPCPPPSLPPLPPSFLPSLSHFTGPPALALLLVPHRPVQHIDLTSSPNSHRLTPSLALSLSQSSAPVVALAATTSSNEDQNLIRVLTVLAASMPHLRHLRVVTNTYADPSTFRDRPPFDDTYFENITGALSSLPDLQSCEIWGFHWVSSKNSNSHKSYSASSTWHSPSFTHNPIPTTTTTTTNFLDDLYQDLIFPY